VLLDAAMEEDMRSRQQAEGRLPLWMLWGRGQRSRRMREREKKTAACS